MTLTGRNSLAQRVDPTQELDNSEAARIAEKARRMLEESIEGKNP